MSIADIVRARGQELVALADQIPAGSPPWPTPVDCLGGTPFLPAVVPPEPTIHWSQRNTYLTPPRSAPRPGSVLFFGDSITEAMCVNEIHPAALNLAIGGESMRSLMNRLADTQAAREAGACVLLSGICDLGNTTYYANGAEAAETVKIMYSQFANWATGKWVIVKLLPVFPPCPISNADIATVNAHVQTLFAGRSGFAVVDATGALSDPNYFDPNDGQHPVGTGYAVLNPLIDAALVSCGL